MVTSTGLHARLSNLCRNDPFKHLEPPRRKIKPAPLLSRWFSCGCGGDGDCDDTRKSFNFCLTPQSFFLLLHESTTSLDLRLLSNIRNVFLRRRWITGLVDGLRVGLLATAHCVANSLNFSSVAIGFVFWYERVEMEWIMVK